MTLPLKIRASKAGFLMTEPKSTKDKEAGNLSEGAKTYIRELWIERTYHRKKEFTNKYVEKGLLNEETGIDFISLYFNEIFEKNTKLFADSYFTGEPDILPEIEPFRNYVLENKCPYDIFTFMKSEMTDLYFGQLQVYMHLTEKPKAKLIYCLTDAPEATIQRELKTASWQLQTPDVSELEAKLRRELCYNDIPLKDKVKVFDLDYDPDYISRLKTKVDKAREYYSTLKL